jgi:hypothetical protein
MTISNAGSGLKALKVILTENISNGVLYLTLQGKLTELCMSNYNINWVKSSDDHTQI